MALPSGEGLPLPVLAEPVEPLSQRFPAPGTLGLWRALSREAAIITSSKITEHFRTSVETILPKSLNFKCVSKV